MNNIGKKKLEKTKKPLKKFKSGSEYGDIDTKLDPYNRDKISIRDIEDLIDKEDFVEMIILMNDVKIVKPKSRKQLISVLVWICPSCFRDLIPQTFIENVSGENFIRTKYVCTSDKNCNYEYHE